MSDLGDIFQGVVGLMTGQFRVDDALTHKRRRTEIPGYRRDNLIKSTLTGIFCAGALGLAACAATGQDIHMATGALAGLLVTAGIRQACTADTAREIESQITVSGPR